MSPQAVFKRQRSDRADTPPEVGQSNRSEHLNVSYDNLHAEVHLWQQANDVGGKWRVDPFIVIMQHMLLVTGH